MKTKTARRGHKDAGVARGVGWVWVGLGLFQFRFVFCDTTISRGLFLQTKVTLWSPTVATNTPLSPHGIAMSASANDDGARRGEDGHRQRDACERAKRDESGEKGEKETASADSSAPKRAPLEGLASGGFDGPFDRIIKGLSVADIFSLLLTSSAFRDAARRAGEEG